MNKTTPLAAAMLALALGTCACQISVPAATGEKKADTPKTDAPKADAAKTAKSSVPEPPKTPAPAVAAKPPKAQLVSAGKRAEPPAPESWDVIQDDDFGLQFRVPSRWNAGTQASENGNLFVAASPDESLVLCVANFQNPDVTDEQILSSLVDNLGFHPDGEYQRVDDGLIVAHGTGNDGSQDVYFLAMVYAIDDVNYLAYIVTPKDLAAKNRETMRQILESFELV